MTPRPGLAPPRRRPRRPRPVTALVMEGFASRLAFGILTFSLPLYARDMGMSIAAIGVLASTTGAVSLLLKPVTGGLVDRWGVRRSVLAALTLRSLLCLGYLVSTVPAHLFAVRGAHGASDAVRDPAVHALIAENGGKRSMAATFAWYQTAKTTAGSIGKGAAGVLLGTALGFKLAFVAAFALSLLPVALIALAAPSARRGATGVRHREDPERPTVPHARSAPATGPVPRPETSRPARRRWVGGRRGGRVVTSPGVAAYAVLGFLVAGTASMLQALFPIIATEYAGLTTSQAGLLYLLTPALAFTGPFWGWVADRVSRSLVLSVRGVANVLSSVIYLLAPSLAGVWVGKCLDDLGKAAFRPAWGSLMADLANRTPAARARTMGYLTAGEDAGTLAAPIAAGLLWTVWGVPAVLVGRVLLAVVAEAYAVHLERRQRRASRATGAADPGRDGDPVSHGDLVRDGAGVPQGGTAAPALTTSGT